MRARVALVIALSLASCSDLFHADSYDVPEGYACSPTGTCPPGQQCVPGEHICRTPCTQTSLNTGGMTGGNNQAQQCSGINSTNGTGYSCDYDHFCRPRCGNTNGTCGGCSGSDVCDETVGVCRPACSAGPCPSTWGCVDLSSAANNGTPSICAGCRPLATATFMAPMFAPIVSYSGPQQTNHVAVGDLAGNGHPDVINSNGPNKQLVVYANDGTGALMAGVTYPVAVTPFDAIVADMNRDGKADVVVATANGPQGGPVLYPGNGDHTLGTPIVGPMLPTTRFAIGDFDGDGQPDVAACGMGTGQLSIVTADGAGGLKQLASFSAGPGDSFVRIGAMDFNGDKHLDLWGDDEHASVRLFQSNGNASLGFSENLSVNGPGPRFDSATADVDGDGKLDFVWVQENGGGSPTMPSNVIIEHNGGNGMFTNPSPSMQTTMPASGQLATADFDGDGHVDVAMLEAGTSKSNVDILSGDGSKLTWSEQIAIAQGGPSSIAAADLDGDGRPDLVIGLGGGGVAVLINQTPAPSH